MMKYLYMMLLHCLSAGITYAQQRLEVESPNHYNAIKKLCHLRSTAFTIDSSLFLQELPS